MGAKSELFLAGVWLYAKVQYLYYTSSGTSPNGDASVYDKTGIILLVSNPALCENISGYLNKDFVRE